MLPIFACLLLPLQGENRQKADDGRIAVLSQNVEKRRFEVILMDPNGKEIASYPCPKGVSIPIRDFRLMPGGKKYLLVVVYRDKPPATGGGPTKSKGLLVDLDDAGSSREVFNSRFFNGVSFKPDGSGVYYTEGIDDPEQSGGPMKMIAKSWFHDFKANKAAELPLNGQQLLDISHDGKTALISSRFQEEKSTFASVSTEDWKVRTKEIPAAMRSRISGDGNAIMQSETRKTENGMRNYLVVNRSPHRESDTVLLMAPDKYPVSLYAFAPDGKRLVFATRQPVETPGRGTTYITSVYRANIDGTGIRQITRYNTNETIRALDWR